MYITLAVHSSKIIKAIARLQVIIITLSKTRLGSITGNIAKEREAVVH